MKKTKICTYGLALAIAALGVSGCGGGSSSNDAPPPNLQKQTEEKYPVSGVLKETDGFAMPGTVTVSATDVNGAAVTLFSDKTGGTPVTSITVADDGMVSFYVDSAAVLPVTVLAKGTTSIPNHLDNSTKFIVDKIGTTFFSINIVDMDFPGPGVVPHEKAGVLDADDTIPYDFNLIATTTNVTIPAKTAFATSAGTPLKGDVKALLTTFTSSTATAPILPDTAFAGDPENGVYATLAESDLENFPGGMGNQNAPNAGYFVTAGFVAVDVIDAAGNAAKNVTNPGGFFTIRMNIPAGTINPETDLPIVASTPTAPVTIPVYTYDSTTLNWKQEVDANNTPVMGTVLSDANGLYVLHTTNHFSYWNLGWLVKKNFCAAQMDFQKDAITMALNVSASFTSAGKNYLMSTLKPAKDTNIGLTNVPKQLLDIVVTDTTMAKNVIWSKKGVDLCKTTPLAISYKAPVSNTPVPVTVNVVEYCSQDNTIRQPVPSTTATVTTSKNNSPGAKPTVVYNTVATGTTDASGNVVFNLAPGKYNFTALDRRTKIYVPTTKPTANPCTVTSATPLVINVEIPVTCVPAPSGSTGGSWIF